MFIVHKFTVQCSLASMFKFMFKYNVQVQGSVFKFNVRCSKFKSSVRSSVFKVQCSCSLFIVQSSVIRVHHLHFNVHFHCSISCGCSGVASACLVSIFRVLLRQHQNTTSQAQLLTVGACG